MKRKLISFLCFSLLALAGSKNHSNRSVDHNGNCTEQFVSDFNSVRNERVSSYKVSESGDDKEKINHLISLEKTCEKFYSTYIEGITCGVNIDDEEQEISSDTHKTACDMASVALDFIEG